MEMPGIGFVIAAVIVVAALIFVALKEDDAI
jgi:hypothetical protein